MFIPRIPLDEGFYTMTTPFYPLTRRLLAAVVAVLAAALALPMVAAQDTPTGAQLGAFAVSYGGRTYNSAANETTFSYAVAGNGQAPDLSHFDVEIPECTPPLLVIEAVPSQAVSFGVDPTTGVDGIKWDLPLQVSESRTYSITFIGNVAEGAVQVAVKAGNGFELASLPGPSCQTASLDVDKFVSADGVAWDDADDAPGPEFQPGTQVSFRFVVNNIGNVELTGLALADSRYDTSACTIPAALAPAAFFECTIGPFPVEDGQHTNIATATASYDGTTITAIDTANYFSGDLPEVTLDKSVSKDGGTTWAESIRIASGRDVWFRLAVTNTGNVPLSGFALTDDVYSTSACAIPDLLDPGGAFECVIGPFSAGDDDLTNTASVTASHEGSTVSATDTASYRVTDDDTSGVVIIIEGPIEQINNNIIVIFGLNIELDPNDSILNTIAIGDVIRVEGDLIDSDVTIIVVAVTVIIVDVDIILVGAPGGAIYVPRGCKIVGGRGNPRLKCSGRSSSRRSS